MPFLTYVTPLTDSRLASVTPSELFFSQRDVANTFWLDNATGGAERDGWSYLGLNPLLRVEAHAQDVSLWQSGTCRSIPCKAPFPCLLHTLGSYGTARQRTAGVSHARTGAGGPDAAVQPGPPFRGGWVGYLGYEGAGLPGTRSRFPEQPEIGSCPRSSFGLFDVVLAFSHAEERWWAAAALLPEGRKADCERRALLRIAQLVEQIAPSRIAPVQDAPLKQVGPDLSCPPLRRAISSSTPHGYREAVRRALEYIAAGDIYQVNLAQRFTIPWELPPEVLYGRLRAQSPAEYGAFLGGALVGNGQALGSVSPELFLRLRSGVVETRPIKGTRPRGSPGGPDDATARRELEESAKERAELNMIVDLERNDLGRVCEYGSVRVVTPGEIQELPTLFHRVATVKGKLYHRFGALDLIKAAFPGGSVTGAPKLRAMEIIAELEPVPRGPYCGAIGWLGLDGDMDLSIAIRTALCDSRRGLAHYHAGSGIVADSDPVREFDETLHKAAAFFRATNAVLALGS